MRFQYLRYFLFCSVFSFVINANADQPAAANKVMVSIKPLALIYAALQPDLPADLPILIPDNRNLHDYSLSINDLQRLQEADTLFWLGTDSEPFIAKLQPRLGKNKHWVALAESVPHAWLDIHQLELIVNKMVAALIIENPQQQAVLEANANHFIQSVKQRLDYWHQQLTPYKDTAFLLGHDAFLPFANTLGLQHAELYRASHDHGHAQAGMQELLTIHKKLSDGVIRCALQEPDVDFTDLAKRFPYLQLSYIEPMARQITPGPDAYLEFIDVTAKAFHQCLMATAKSSNNAR